MNRGTNANRILKEISNSIFMILEYSPESQHLGILFQWNSRTYVSQDTYEHICACAFAHHWSITPFRPLSLKNDNIWWWFCGNLLLMKSHCFCALISSAKKRTLSALGRMAAIFERLEYLQMSVGVYVPLGCCYCCPHRWACDVVLHRQICKQTSWQFRLVVSCFSIENLAPVSRARRHWHILEQFLCKRAVNSLRQFKIGRALPPLPMDVYHIWS